MKSAKTIVIAASVVFLAVCLGAYSAEQDDAAPAKVVPTPVRAARTPARPGAAIEEEAPQPRPVTRTPVRATPPRTPPRAPTRTPSPTTPTRPSSRTTPTRPTPTRAVPGRRPRPPEDPHKDTVILVEAFMVQVRLSSLHSQGVPQISEGCKSVSAEHIIKLMKTTDAAVVTAGAKIVVGQKNEAKTKTSTRQSILSGSPDKKVVRREYVNVGTTFTAVAEVRRDDKIFVNMEFEHSAVEASKGGDDSGMAVERQWTSSVLLQDGKPTLVGATQDKETGTFLIVTAHIKD